MDIAVDVLIATELAKVRGMSEDEIAAAGAKTHAKRARLHNDGYVYFIENTVTKNIKIGWAYHPSKRVKALQVGNDCALKLLNSINGDIAREKSIHKLLAEHRVLGEWFSPSPDVIEFMKTAVSDEKAAQVASAKAATAARRKSGESSWKAAYSLWEALVPNKPTFIPIRNAHSYARVVKKTSWADYFKAVNYPFICSRDVIECSNPERDTVRGLYKYKDDNEKLAAIWFNSLWPGSTGIAPMFIAGGPAVRARWHSATKYAYLGDSSPFERNHRGVLKESPELLKAICLDANSFFRDNVLVFYFYDRREIWGSQ
jgi:hypothetical protein